MADLVASRRLTEFTALKMLKAAVGAARKLSAPCGVAIVDAGGVIRAWALMDGATPLASEVVPKKARTAAFTARSTGALPPELGTELALPATDFVNRPRGLPIIVDGQVVGAIAGHRCWRRIGGVGCRGRAGRPGRAGSRLISRPAVTRSLFLMPGSSGRASSRAVSMHSRVGLSLTAP